MLDTKLLRENFDEVKKSLANRGFDLDKNHFDEIDKQRKSLQIEVENLQSEKERNSHQNMVKEKNLDKIPKRLKAKLIALIQL